MLPFFGWLSPQRIVRELRSVSDRRTITLLRPGIQSVGEQQLYGRSTGKTLLGIRPTSLYTQSPQKSTRPKIPKRKKSSGEAEKWGRWREEIASTPPANGPVCLSSTAAVLHPCRCEIPDKQTTTRRETVRPESLVRYVRCGMCLCAAEKPAVKMHAPLFRMAVAAADRTGTPVGIGPENHNSATARYSVGRRTTVVRPINGKAFAGYTAKYRTRSRATKYPQGETQPKSEL